tara:strand:- start:116 stop:1045 length:930 start_codon:yes stop_codon:yes gene_type:complete
MKALFCEHPDKPLLSGGYCSYYSEIFYALKEVFDIEFTNFVPRHTSEFDGFDIVFLGFGHTDSGYAKPITLTRNSDIKLFPILNKEYVGLNNKLDWIKEMQPTAALTVHHDLNYYTKYTGFPFHRIMWSANENQFKNYGGEYKNDLFFSGVTRPEQTENLRERVLSQLDKLSDYKLFINARSHKNNYAGTMFSDDEYARHLSSSKICLITTGPADLVGTRYFEVMAGNRSLILCNRMNENVYEDILIDGYNCVMFSDEDEFFEKAIYYLENEDQRMTIVSKAYEYFIRNQTWSVKSKNIKSIIDGYINV